MSHVVIRSSVRLDAVTLLHVMGNAAAAAVVVVVGKVKGVLY